MGKDKPFFLGGTMVCLLPINTNTMITIYMDFMLPKSQESYDLGIEQSHILSLKCPCCSSVGNFEKHGFYERSIKIETPDNKGKLVLSISRVKCLGCGKTHALLPTWIVPYSQHLLEDQIEIIESFEKGEKIGPMNSGAESEIDLENIRYIIKQCHYFHRRSFLRTGYMRSTRFTIQGIVYITSNFKSTVFQFR
jgi:hypothetical protein